MEIHVKRRRQGNNSTLSVLYIDGEHVCYVLEDSVRDKKIKGRTAIPAGRYKLAFRPYGGMHGRYHRLFPDFHKGMIQLMDVPNFSYIYIHMGNNFADTAGCLLVGKTKKYFKKSHEFEIRKSKKAYIPLYKRLAAMMEKGDVFIKIHELSSCRMNLVHPK